MVERLESRSVKAIWASCWSTRFLQARQAFFSQYLIWCFSFFLIECTNGKYQLKLYLRPSEPHPIKRSDPLCQVNEIY